MARFRRRRGVSEVVGALLLIVVVVSAVASLAYFISGAQRQAEARNSYLTSLQDDNLEVTHASFSPNDPLIQWELDGCTVSAYSSYDGNWDVQQVLSNPGVVNLYPKNSDAIAKPKPLLGVQLTGGLQYNAIAKGTQAALAATAPYTLSPGSGCIFNPDLWDNITLTVRNANTQPSSVEGVQLEGVWRHSWYQVDQAGQIMSTLGIGKNPLVIPARGVVNILLKNATGDPIAVQKTDTLSVVLFSGVGNYFTTFLAQPSAIPKSSSSTQNYQQVTRDILTFDGSQSFASNGSIQSYVWKLDVPTRAYAQVSGCTSTAFAYPSNFDTSYVLGETTQYSPESLIGFNPGDCITGPIRATLMVTDTNGFMAASQPILIAPDPNIDPVGSISASKSGTLCTPSPCTSTYTVTVSVDDIFGSPVVGAVVNAIKIYGDVSSNYLSQSTNSSGQATFTITFTNGGSMDFETGTLLPSQVSFP